MLRRELRQTESAYYISARDADFLAGLHPLGRMGETSEIAEAVLYLESAGFVTGETLHMDGGAHAGK
jgi:NAD(P)-dependent dehydrogenase (short-subunit alcohol dehydrogenase family)